MGVSLCDLSPDHQQRLKASICRYLPRAAQRGRAWRGLYGLSQMGVRWLQANVKLRNALEGCLLQYALVPNWAYIPKELAVVLHSLHAMVRLHLVDEPCYYILPHSSIWFAHLYVLYNLNLPIPSLSFFLANRVCPGPHCRWTPVYLSLLRSARLVPDGHPPFSVNHSLR